MSKRRADVELNQDNWDDDTTTAESSGFEKADKDSLASRKILTVCGNRASKTRTSGVFKSFTGFSNTSAAPVMNFNFGAHQAGGPDPLRSSITSDSKCTGDSVDKEAEYLRQLQNLNRSLLDWVKKHIDEDPHCILTPVFSDYDKHLCSLHEKFPEHKPQSIAKTSSESNKSTGIGSKNVEIDTKSSGSSVPSTTISFNTPFSFEPKSTNAPQPAAAVAKPFTFNLPPITSSIAAPLFKFGSSLPSSSPFGAAAAPMPTESQNGNADEDNEEYHPPKPEVKEIKEEGSVYTVRCKLFYKVDTEWRERGVGNLYIKPTSPEKFQLLVRADTNLGNILLNILFTRDMPVKQQKNNLTFVCVPTPPVPGLSKQQQQQSDTPKPIPMLIRVKTENNATELLNKMNEHRGVTGEAH